MTTHLGPEDVQESPDDKPYTVTIVTHGLLPDTGEDNLMSFVYTIKAANPTNASMFAQALCVRECQEENIDWQMLFVASIFQADMDAEASTDIGSLLPENVNEDGDITFYSAANEDEVIDVATSDSIEMVEEDLPVVKGGLFDFSS